MVDNTSEILSRIMELRHWQDTEMKSIPTSSNTSAFDHKRIYEALGFSRSFISEITESEQTNSVVNTPRSASEPDNEALNNSVEAETVAKGNANKQQLTINNVLAKETNVYKPRPIENGPRRPFLKRGEGLKNRFKVNPDQFRLQNLPKYKYTKKRSRDRDGKQEQGSDKMKSPDNSPLKVTADMRPVRKSCLKSDQESSVFVKESPVKCAEVLIEGTEGEVQVVSTAGAPRRLKFNHKSPVVTFDSEIIKIPFENYFETSGESGSEVHHDHEESIQSQGDEDEQEEEGEIDTEPGERRLQMLQVGTRVTNYERAAEEEDSDTEAEDIEISEAILNCISNRRMAFPQAKAETQLAKYDAVNSTPIEVSRLRVGDHGNATLSPRSELIEKGSILRTKLKELEHEIETFRSQNQAQLKMRQALELEKVELVNKKQEFEGYLHDQRVKLEIYLHDERVKVEEDRIKYEGLLQEFKVPPSKKAKEELKALREKVEDLEKELKSREVKHGASQSRLRTQIRSLEKENKERDLQIESLKKENKKLDGENGRLRRQNNNKMLQEINKNIAKLGGNATDAPATKETDNPKPRSKRLSTPPAPKMKQSATVITVVAQEQKKNERDSLSNTSDDEDDDNGIDENCNVIVDQKSGRSLDAFRSSYFPPAGKEKQNKASIAAVGPERLSEKQMPWLPSSDAASNSAKSDLKVGRKEVANSDGSKEIWYPNGNLKKVSADGMTVKMLYFNKDIKETNINEGTVKYYYAESNTWHTSYLDGLEIFEFPSGQTEHRFKDGKIEIYFADGSVRVTNPKERDVVEEWRYPDGTVACQMKSGERVITMSNGQREIHAADHKRREYPDGTVKTVFDDGRTETRYPNGRTRVKDKQGNLISDSQPGFH